MRPAPASFALTFASFALVGCRPEARADATNAPSDTSAAATDSEASASSSPSTLCEDAEPEQSVRPGVNDSYTADATEKFAERFSRDGREVSDRKADVLQLLGLAEGMHVADVGSGTGLYTVDLARAVGPAGSAYAVDVTAPFLDHVRGVVDEAALDNVEFVLAEPRDANLPHGSIDVALMSNVYHHVEFPLTYMRSLHCALKPDGRLVLIDFIREEGPDAEEWLLKHVRAGEAVVTEELRAAGFDVTRLETALEENYVLELRKSADAAPNCACPSS